MLTSGSDELIREIRLEFPRFRIVQKVESPFAKVLDVVLKLVTFGAQRAFLTHYHTVLFDTLYVPQSWDDTPDVARLITLRHERVHLRQRRRYGDLGLTFLYLVPFFPLGLAYGRARLEWEAYTETLRATAEYHGLAEARAPELRARIVRQFTGGAYGWMWPFEATVSHWYDEALAQIEREMRSDVMARGNDLSK